ncbi:class II fructose-bisphosphate aldolase [Saccharibacter sp. 17.LH.SD]|uniref:class II fructose-bisphosphate aldolase n=1 Tax=Saccharibacter sp. 17.LH.SD TaxID=2689393 RepID=UPI00136B6F1C|nr:class II fructose-bisphosphate aldolase [Saccharibacter sp. 17.LH.SD]MXV45289.1 class II fructose-bisphosphate aldolase [Saccharibacter sp. 17.LH.SD]
MPCASALTKIPPGVVVGEDYLTLLNACRQGGYALPAINVTCSNMVNAVLEAAALNKSDIVIQISGSGAQFYGGMGLKDAHRARSLGALAMARHVHTLAKEYGICVILHTDHADRSLIPWLDDLITFNHAEYTQTGRPLFSSHMLDLSTEPLECNLSEAEKMLRRLAPLGIGLEIELGITGGEEDGIGKAFHDNGMHDPALYTQPADVLAAWKRLSPLGAISIAASFGNVHGVYKPGNIKLRPEILKASQELVSHYAHGEPKPLSFVFHGGSGSEKDKIHEAVSYGVFKMNIDTDTQFAFAKGASDYIHHHAAAFAHQVCPDTGQPFKKQYDPRQWLRAGEKKLVERLNVAFVTLQSEGKTIAHS